MKYIVSGIVLIVALLIVGWLIGLVDLRKEVFKEPIVPDGVEIVSNNDGVIILRNGLELEWPKDRTQFFNSTGHVQPGDMVSLLDLGNDSFIMTGRVDRFVCGTYSWSYTLKIPIIPTVSRKTEIGKICTIMKKMPNQSPK